MFVDRASALTALLILLNSTEASAQAVRVIKFSESVPFQMGEVTSRRIVHPDMGAKNTTLNLSVSKPGNEFAQHVHDYSDDTILVLAGEVDLRQGGTLHRFRAGECAFVPAGQIHGTITAGTGEATMISFQNPPDLVLYTGARDSKKPGASAPKGVITPGAVKFLDFASKSGLVTSKAMGSERAAFAHRKLKAGERLNVKVDPGHEQFFFVWKGALQAKDSRGMHSAGERDTIFITGPAQLTITAGPRQGATVIHVQAPEQKSSE